MRAIELAQFGLEHLTATERDVPQPGPGEVLIRVSAVSLNYRDLLMVTGQYNPRQKLPMVPASDGVGKIVAAGPGVDSSAMGTRVAGMFCQHWYDGPPRGATIRATLGGPLDGMLSEYVVLPIEGVSPVPDYLSNAEAACLPCAALTAWSALVSEGDLRPGQTALVQGTGGVSIFALQIAKAMGARVIVTSSKDTKLAKAAVMGAHHCINYESTPEWGKRARQLTGGSGVDLVVEVGGAGTLQQSMRAVRVGGTICQIGVLSGRKSPIDVTPILMRNIRLQGVLVGSHARFEAMCRAFALHRIKPAVDEVFALDDARAAFEYLGEARHFGKVCIALSPET